MGKSTQSNVTVSSRRSNLNSITIVNKDYDIFLDFNQNIFISQYKSHNEPISLKTHFIKIKNKGMFRFFLRKTIRYGNPQGISLGNYRGLGSKKYK